MHGKVVDTNHSGTPGMIMDQFPLHIWVILNLNICLHPFSAGWRCFHHPVISTSRSSKSTLHTFHTQQGFKEETLCLTSILGWSLQSMGNDCDHCGCCATSMVAGTLYIIVYQDGFDWPKEITIYLFYEVMPLVLFIYYLFFLFFLFFLFTFYLFIQHSRITWYILQTITVHLNK